MLTQSEIDQIIKLIQSTSERKAAETLGVTHAVLQRAVPLSISPENESIVRAHLQVQLHSDNPPQPSPVVLLKAQERITLLKEKEMLLEQRDARRREERRQERLEREQARAQRDARRREEREAERREREESKARRKGLIT